MKTRIQTIIAFFGLICCSCVPSIHPLYTNADLAFEPALIGVWMESESAETWEFSLAATNEYRLIHTDETGKKGEFEARLVKLGGHMFLDLYPTRASSSQNDFYRGHLLSVHTFAKITRAGTGYQVAFLEPKWLKSHLEKNVTALRHAVIDEEILITDSTANLQKLVTSSIESPGAFSAPINMRRKDGKK